jgi:hypothetical protein
MTLRGRRAIIAAGADGTVIASASNQASVGDAS